MRHLSLKAVGLIAAVVVLALGAGAAAGGEAKATKQVEAGGMTLPQNTYFDPKSLSIHKGDKVRWNFTGTFTHDVYLNSGPKGVDKSKYRFGAKDPGEHVTAGFRKRGDYKFICTLHSATMRMTVTVKR